MLATFQWHSKCQHLSCAQFSITFRQRHAQHMHVQINATMHVAHIVYVSLLYLTKPKLTSCKIKLNMYLHFGCADAVLMMMLLLLLQMQYKRCHIFGKCTVHSTHCTIKQYTVEQSQ